MNKDLRNQIISNLEAKETEELVEIWQTNDRSEWPGITFAIIRKILRGRLGELPHQDKPIRKFSKINEEYLQNSFRLDELLNENNPPEFYDPHKVLKIDKWFHKAAIALITVTAIKGLLNLENTQAWIQSIFSGVITNDFLAWVLAILYFILNTGIYCVVVYLMLTSLGSVLKILMGMEFNSRNNQGTGAEGDQ